ncbi:hypothetical protein BSKO_13704 [Bryopsis sp. KO-2023]|nr:hypothetical protein BSKO_13704 [Bryopsis sp. KO-2023]
MSLSALAPRHVFGFRGDVRDNIYYVEDGTAVFPVGHNVALYHVESRMQKLIPGSVESEGITTIAVSSNKRHLAVAERADKGMITIFDLQTLKRRKVLVSVDAGSKEYVSLSFSHDGKLLAAQGGAPEWNLLLWLWEKSKVASTIKTTNQQGNPVYHCLFSPSETSIVSVIGQNILKTFKTVDGHLKLQPSALAKRDPQNYKCQVWMVDADKERIILGTDSGELLVIEGGEIKTTLSIDNSLSIESIVTHSKGFVVGHEGGVVNLFEKDEKDMFRRGKSFAIENQPYKILNMAISPSEDQLACTLENNQAYTLALANTEIMKTDDMNFELLATPFHSKGILGVDTCIRKPLIATCSMDKTIRLWNYLDKSVELVKVFSEEAYSVALHPTGMTILVGFADKLRLMTILMDDLRTVKEMSIRACRECKFSNGGQYYAAVNGNTVQLYNTYSCENIGNLRGHNGKVRSLHWSEDDSRLISAGMDGAVYEWRLKDFKREKENVLKGCNYTCVLSTPDSKSIYAVGSDMKLKEMEDTQGSGTQITKEIDAGTILTEIALPAGGRTLFAATQGGTVRSYKYPLTGEFHEYKCHNGPITRLALGFDDNVLVATSEDSSLFVFDVKDKDPTRGLAKREQEKTPWAEEVLITKSELEEKKQRMSDLELQVNELTMQTEYQLRLKDLHMQEKVKELTDKFGGEIDGEKQKFDLLLQEKNEMELEYEEKLRAAQERGQQQLNALDSQYQQKIMAEVERYQQLVQEKELLNERWDEQNALLVESHERVIQELTEEYETKLHEEHMNLEGLQQEKEELEREFEEIKRQLEEDADREIEELKERYEQRLSQEREVGLRLKGQNGIMRKKFNALQKDIEAQKEEIKSLFDQKKELYQTIASLEKDIMGLKREIRERDETIGDKERRIYDLKKKNQELEKFKFVLDYKIKELKKQIEPREMEIADMKEQVKEMDSELERYHKNNANLDLTISNLKLKETALLKEIQQQQNAKNDAILLVKRFKHDLHELVQFVQFPKQLREKVKDIYHRHVHQSVQLQHIEEDIQQEYQRQREYLEKTVDGLKRKLNKEIEVHKTNTARIMQENVALIKEINELRRELKQERTGTVTLPKSPPAKKPPPPELDVKKEFEIQRDLIRQLRQEVSDKETRIKMLEQTVVPRPVSRERLPPVDYPLEEAQ